jgi:hypothetical protein
LPKTMRPQLILGTGKSLPTLEYFPKQLQGIAEEVERVSKAIGQFWYDVRSDNTFLTRFGELPTILHDYATFLKQTLRLEKDNININTDIARLEANAALSSLCETMRQAKSRPMYTEVAALLTGAAENLGVANDEQEYSPDALKMRVGRLRKSHTYR